MDTIDVHQHHKKFSCCQSNNTEIAQRHQRNILLQMIAFLILLCCTIISITLSERLRAVQRLPFPYDRISYTQYQVPASAVTAAEYSRQSECSFIGFGDSKAQTARCDMELIEHQLVAEYIPAHAKVLELGARFGTTSCMISRKVFNKGVLVSVEPDARVWRYLDYNRRSHRCSFYIVHEPIGNSTVSVGRGNYETIASYSETPQKKTSDGRYTFYTYSEIETATQVRFDTLLIDCEGCIAFLFEDNDRSLKDVLRSVNLIIIEADNPSGPTSPCVHSCVDYPDWIGRLHAIEFRTVRQERDSKFKWIIHYVLRRS